MEVEEDIEEKEDIYAWEKTYERTWELITEDERGLRSLISEKKRRKRTQQRDARKIRRGMTRYLFLIIDCSKSLNQTDFKPSRHTVFFKIVEQFILDYFDQNPLSQMGIIISRNSVAEKVTELAGNGQRHIAALQRWVSGGEGEFSLQNPLGLALGTLTYAPLYGSREVVVLAGAMTVCDPGDIFATLSLLRASHVRVSVVGVQAEVHVYKALALRSGGSYAVGTSEESLRSLLLAHSPPPPASQEMTPSLIRMGFPEQRMDSVPSLCVCHQTLKKGGYYCPQCMSKFCELPIDCHICSLSLISAPHLARSYHHLFPVPIFTEQINIEGKKSHCFSCLIAIEGEASSFQCPECSTIFCSECDDYIHESLHNCPGCQTKSTRIKDR